MLLNAISMRSGTMSTLVYKYFVCCCDKDDHKYLLNEGTRSVLRIETLTVELWLLAETWPIEDVQ